jgi:hypothetical protein
VRHVAALLLVAGALVAVTCATASPRVVRPVTLTIHVGKHGVAGGPKTLTVHKGRRVVLVVYSTIGKEVHLHGYDLEKPIRSRTTPVRIPFVARVAGVFEIELHVTESQELRIGTLTVR